MNVHAMNDAAARNASAAANAAATGEDESITVSTTIETKTVKNGFFRRVADRFERNPIKSAVGTTAAIGLAALGGYNYNRTGNVLGNVDTNDLREVAAAAAVIFA